MGAIQNSINGVLGTGAAAATIGKKLSMDAAATESAERQELAGLPKSIAEGEQEITGLEETVANKEFAANYAKTTGNFVEDNNDISMGWSPEARAQNIKKAEQALKVAQENLTAKQTLMKAYKQRFAELSGKYGKEINK